MFDYRIAYGCWLNDSRLKPIRDEDWPSVRIDEGTLDSLEQTAAFLQQAGYNYLDVFGLVTNNNWKPDIAATVGPERVRLVRRAVDIIRGHGMKLIYGLGVYSWGFEEIIRENPGVRGTSAQVMCASSPESEAVMQHIIEYLMAAFDFDGFHLEAADQGRCHCERCAQIPDDIDYYNRINRKVARFIRSRWPDKVLLVNTSGYLAWGDTFNARQLDQIVDLGNEVDVFIDVGSHGAFVDVNDRRETAARMKASFGTANGFWVYPPQRWERDRWLLPHFMVNYRHLQALYRDGGRSCELYLSPISNPGARLTQMFNGLFLQNPLRPAEDILRETVEVLYQPANDAERDFLADFFVRAEELFFSCWNPVRDRSLPEELSDGVEQVFQWSEVRPDKAVPGEIFLEPLFGVGPGFPCYLTVHFDQAGREKYRRGTEALLRELLAFRSAGLREALAELRACLENILKDIATVRERLGEA